MESTSNSKGLVIGIAAVIVVGLVSFVTFKGSKTSEVTTDALPVAEAPAVLPASVTPTASGTAYKNGTYTADGTYTSPGGRESVKVTLTLEDDIVTDATVVGQATNPRSVNFQGQFIGGYKPLVIGKKLSGLKLDKVAGSSLTGKGFNDAVAKIQAEAQA